MSFPAVSVSVRSPALDSTNQDEIGISSCGFPRSGAHASSSTVPVARPVATTSSAMARRGARAEFPDWRFAPNIGGHPASYELENEAVDRAGHVLAAMRHLAPWAGRTLVDLGCGTGYWLPRYAADAARVIGVEPDPA